MSGVVVDPRFARVVWVPVGIGVDRVEEEECVVLDGGVEVACHGWVPVSSRRWSEGFLEPGLC